jgi:hypothetical protein
MTTISVLLNIQNVFISFHFYTRLKLMWLVPVQGQLDEKLPKVDLVVIHMSRY